MKNEIVVSLNGKRITGSEMVSNSTDKADLSTFVYRDWRNNWLTLERMAEHYEIEVSELEALINQGRKEQERLVQKGIK